MDSVTVTVKRAVGKFGEIVMTQSSFDVRYKVGNAAEWSVERQTTYQITGDGLHNGGMDERRARARWERSLALFEAVEVQS